MEENSSTDATPKAEVETEFKKPVLVGRIGKLPKKAKPDVGKAPQAEQNPEKSNAAPESSSKSIHPPAVSLKEILVPISYKEPKWSGLCPDGTDYALEVVKSGMILEKVELTTKSYYVFGRLANCDVVMTNPTVSRHHAVLQYKAFEEADEPPSGWYLYDLGSTHGTFVNRERVRVEHYTRVRVGHQIKFGNSTRIYILMGPDFDCEGESKLTVTEIKQRAQHMKQERDRMISEAMEQREKNRVEEEKKREEQGIDWGMGDDAEEETDLSENPFAVTNNEELFLQDPKKTLRGYFEREGQELVYDCEERGVGQFLCRVELPMEDARGQPVVAEVLHRGKKKEAVVACALAACRALDRCGLLRQATHEPRRRKQRDWGADDYYDSDDDTFLDRTGTVERKRDKRRDKQASADAVTYDQLLDQIKELETQLSSEQATLERLRAQKQTPADSEDYMQIIPGNTMAHKAEISKARMSASRLAGALGARRRLAALARPAAPPPRTSSGPALKSTNSVVYGKRIRLKEDKKPPKPQPQKKEETEFVEEMDSDDEPMDKKERSTDNTNTTDTTELKDKTTTDKDKTTVTTDTTELKDKTTTDTDKTTVTTDTTELKDKTATDSKDVKEEKEEKVKRVFGPMRPPDNYEVPENYFNQESDRDLPEMTDE